MSLSNRGCPNQSRLRAFIHGATALALVAGPARGQEIAPFRLTDVSGSLSITGWRESQSLQQADTGTGGGTQSRTTQTDMRVGLFVDTRSYIYHPNLVTLDLGGGPIFEAASFVTDSVTNRSRKSLYDLNVRATLLREKPYRGSIYFQHLNPTLSIAPADVLVTESEKYGLEASLLKPVTPVPAHVEVWRSTTRGRGTTRVVDDEIQNASLRLDYSFGKDGNAQLSYTQTQQRSASGSPSLPIQTSDQVSESVDLTAQTRFGADREWLLQTPVNFFRQSYTLSQGQAFRNDSLRAAVDLRGTHLGGKLMSFARYDRIENRLLDSSWTSQALTASLAYTPDSQLSGTIGARAETEDRVELSASRYQLDGTLHYRRPLGIGTLTAGYSTLLGQRDQRATSAIVPVQGEQVVLSGTTQVALARTNVVAGSVVVSNINRSQTYVLGLDYLLDTLGLQTRVQRVASGAIGNGETVLVDYDYDAGGTFAFRQFDNIVDLGWALDSYVSLGVRYLDSAQSLLSGSPTTPLNSVRDLIVSAQLDLPFRLGVEMAAGGLAEWESRRETVLSSQRNLVQLYWQTLVPGFEWMSLRTGWRRAQIDYDAQDSADVDATGWDLSLWAFSPAGISFQATYNDQRDTGGGTPRRERIATGRASWQYRQLSLTAWGTYDRETQGDSTRSRGRVDFLLKRGF